MWRVRLVNTINYDESNLPSIYSIARQLPRETINLWLDTIQDHIEHPIDTILDLGCGEGRFSSALSNAFHAKVYGIDPSWKMLALAQRRDSRATHVQYIRGCGEHMPVHDHQISMAFMSMVLHHLENVDTTIAEILRVLSPHGYLAIRNTTREDIHQSECLKFFPTAKQFDLQRMPRTKDLIARVTAQGFQLVASNIVKQVFAHDYRKYYEKISQRGLSGLLVISDYEFHSGLKRLKQYCEQQPHDVKVWEPLHFFLFQNLSCKHAL
jgi:ubiquinone/menaquinone biosynthesis C-methylase UbiE